MFLKVDVHFILRAPWVGRVGPAPASLPGRGCEVPGGCDGSSLAQQIRTHLSPGPLISPTT